MIKKIIMLALAVMFPIKAIAMMLCTKTINKEDIVSITKNSNDQMTFYYIAFKSRPFLTISFCKKSGEVNGSESYYSDSDMLGEKDVPFSKNELVCIKNYYSAHFKKKSAQ